MTFYLLFVSLLIAFASGYFVVHMLWPNHLTGKSMIVLEICAAAGVGFGITSLVYFTSAVFWGTESSKYYVLETTVLALLAATFLYQRRNLTRMVPETASIVRKVLSRKQVVISIGLYALIIIAIIRFILVAIKIPHGDWDAVSIWNLRARFLTRGGDLWRDAFSPVIGWSHPDYPLLLPTSVARLWKYSADETTVAPAFLALFYTISPVVLIYVALNKLKGKSLGFLAIAVMLSIPFYIDQGASQYADTPLSFYFVITVILMSLHDTSSTGYPKLLFLAGITAGFSAWTKNEGMLFIVALAAARFIVFIKKKGLRNIVSEMSLFGVGLLPGVTAFAYFKRNLAPPNDLINVNRSQELMTNLMDYSRYIDVCRACFNYFMRSLWAYALVLLLCCALFFGSKIDKHNKLTIQLLVCTLAIVVTGYFLAYVITPNDISWHVGTSLKRLVLQLWPTIIFASFMALSVKEGE
jgi:hypothetical protein